MPAVSAVLIRLDEAQRAGILSEVRGIELGFSDALSASDWRMRQWEVVGLLLDDDNITHWALARRTRRVATGKVRVEFERVTPGALALREVEQRVPAGLRRYVGSARTGVGGHLPQQTWLRVKEAISQIAPAVRRIIDSLERARDASVEPISRPGAAVVAQQRDAIGLALDAFDQTHRLRSQTLKAWVPSDGEVDGPLTSFLDGLEVKTVEQQLIARDSHVFDGAEKATVTIAGAVFRTGKRVLEVFNIDHHTTEKALGVDLVYHNRAFDAWTLIQYKVFLENRRGSRRGPIDEQCEKGLARMKRFRAAIKDDWPAPRSSTGYRLCSDGFFFKFCDRTQLEVLSDSLLPGLYLPRLQLETLIESGELKTERGKHVLTDDNVGRYFSNTTFASLLRDGWIGTRGPSSNQIAAIVREALTTGRSVVLANARVEDDAAEPQEVLGELGLSTG